jgi:hypothetical protein
MLARNEPAVMARPETGTAAAETPDSRASKRSGTAAENIEANQMTPC